MLTRNSLSLADAQFLVEEACKAAAAEGAMFKICVTVVDNTTFMQAFARMDGAPLFAAQGSYDKAQSSAEGGHPTTFFEKPLNEGRLSVLKLPHTPVEGGLPVIVGGQCVGAVGVAGAPPHLDAKIAQAAIDAFLGKESAK